MKELSKNIVEPFERKWPGYGDAGGFSLSNSENREYELSKSTTRNGEASEMQTHRQTWRLEESERDNVLEDSERLKSAEIEASSEMRQASSLGKDPQSFFSLTGESRDDDMADVDDGRCWSDDAWVECWTDRPARLPGVCTWSNSGRTLSVADRHGLI
jgi:hypothetical protein